MTLLEIAVVTAVIGTLATAGTVSVVDQVRRTRAVDAAHNTFYPHTVARDRAVASRTCTETILVPPNGQPFAPPTGFPAGSQRNTPRVAVIEWTSCEDLATIVRVEFFELEGDITLTPYDTVDARVVFGPTGGLTADRPQGGGGVTLPNCSAPKGGGLGGPSSPAEGEGEPSGGSTCKPAPPLPPPVDDVTFSAVTFFGSNVSYRIYARVGATEEL